MTERKVKVNIYTDRKDITSIKSSLSRLDENLLDLTVYQTKNFVLEPADIIITKISSIQSGLINKILEAKNNFSSKFVFVVEEDNALLLSSLAKLGFTELFVIPYELSRFSSYFKELFDGLSHSQDEVKNVEYISEQEGFSSIIGESEKLKKVISSAQKVSERSNANVIIFGETGTGKGMLAKAIHNAGSSDNFPFVDIVCTAIPESLMESELFGYESGAFTSAKSRKFGLFELAENGSLFLDEIGDLSLPIQAKLLRAIEKKVIRRVGGIYDIPFNARIISATNRNLEKMIEEKTFRRDLYHRLNVISIELPPLRERGDDSLLLANKFVDEFNKQFNKKIESIDDDLENFILKYPWPGNIRELRNAIERAVLLSENNILKLKDFAAFIEKNITSKSDAKPELTFSPNFINLTVDYRKTELRELEKEYAVEVVKKLENKSRAAKLLGISRPKLDSLLK